MKQDLLNLYYVDIKYIHDLHNVDDNVMSVSPQIGKKNRPFLGVIVIMDTKKYCIPLTSPDKDKFKVKSKEDFIKIPDPKLRTCPHSRSTLIFRRIFRITSLIFLEIHQVCLRKIASLCEKSAAFCRRHNARNPDISVYVNTL